MAAEIKFCGLTRLEDAAMAAALGARYGGVIFAGGPRRLTPERARPVLDALGRGVGRVGVFGADGVATIVETARALRLDVVQLHGDPSAEVVAAVRAAFDGEVWPVLRLSGGELPASLAALLDAASAVVLDALVPGQLGGSGVALDWAALAPRLASLRAGRKARLVLAGGLRPENVARAIALAAPDVVDVSSGVEASVGVKDHARMRAFSEAVRGEPEGP